MKHESGKILCTYCISSKNWFEEIEFHHQNNNLASGILMSMILQLYYDHHGTGHSCNLITQGAEVEDIDRFLLHKSRHC